MSQTIKKIDKNITMVFGTIDMFIPEGGNGVRQALIQFTGVEFSEEPTVNVTIHSNKTGLVFGVWGIDKVGKNGQNLIKVSAANVSTLGEGSDGYFYCEYIIIGKTIINK
jgi:hypothetical protein